ncbi:xanthine dehydrogenase family protein subunit M [Candidatus Poribacteria bacterium]|nr:xanthine dehydrogenase family protein subunit M [Candidatus Poribacteria bacterium]
MKSFEYVTPSTVEQAVRALGAEGGLALAGGMDLVPTLQEHLIAPDRLVNLKAVDGLRYIRAEADGLRIGALTTLADIAGHPAVRDRYTALAQAAETVGSPQIRNVGTLGGNLCQRPRCWYFRNEDYHCLKKGGDRCFAADTSADNQYHAILGGMPCHIVHPSNTATALVALSASVSVTGPNGSRVISLDDFFVLPRTRLYAENVLESNEIITEVHVPTPAAGSRSLFLEAADKSAFDWAVSGVAVAVTLTSGRVRSARIVLHAVAPIPWRARKAEDSLTGAVLSEAVVKSAADAALAGAKALSNNAYKIPLTTSLVRRALAEIA